VVSKLPLLGEILDAIDGCPFEGVAYLNVKTGATYTDLGDEFSYDEDESDKETLREIEESEDWIALPTKQDLDEYRIMEDFCGSLPEGGTRNRLEDVIHGKGAFRRFKDVVHRTNSQDQWYAFRDERLKREIADWLDQEKIPYQR